MIGTPLSVYYPRDNKNIQRFIGEKYLVISQVPVCCYDPMDYKARPHFFPARNATMSALTEATVIVEAGNTSGTLTQARAALKQQRKLFILESCFRNKELTWPRFYEDQGAVRVASAKQILEHLA